MATRRQPRMNAGEKAAITKAARDLSEKVNGEQLQRIKELENELTLERRENRRNDKARRNRTRASERGTNGSQQRRRRAQRNGTPEKRKCHGLNLVGKPCGQSPLIPDRWEGPEKVTGLYCLWHEPVIERDKKLAFQLTGNPQEKVFQRVTPGEMAHEIIQQTPYYFLSPYLKSLGLKMDPETKQLVKAGLGLRLYGYSRGGEVIRSPYPDYVGQVQVVEKLLDRVYGKARQSVDLASMNTTVAININMDPDRVDKVASVLAEAGALPNGNGEVIESTAEDIVDEEPESE